MIAFQDCSNMVIGSVKRCDQHAPTDESIVLYLSASGTGTPQHNADSHREGARHSDDYSLHILIVCKPNEKSHVYRAK